MRGVIVALPLSIVSLAFLSSAVWACEAHHRWRPLCGHEERVGPWLRGEQIRERIEREKIEGEAVARDRIQQRIDQAVAQARREIEEAARARVETEMKAAVELKKSAETLQEILAEQIVKTKKAQEEAAQHQREADDKAKQADEAKKAADEQARLLKADRERHEARLVELLAQDPCGGGRRAEGGAGTH
jgi:membrane protein involved in colicin uptake